MDVARSGNSSVDELPAPDDYRTGCPEGGGVMPEVSWTSDKHRGGVSALVELYRTTFVFRINSSEYFDSTGQFIRQTVRRGGGSMFGMLEGCGVGMDIIFVIVGLF